MKSGCGVLAGVSLAPVGEMIVNLLGKTTRAEWTPFGCSYSTHMAEWTPESGQKAATLMAETEKVVEKATKSQLVAFLETHGKWVPTGETKRSLVCSVMILINEKRYPKRFINPKGEV